MDFTNCGLLHFYIETFENGECVGIRRLVHVYATVRPRAVRNDRKVIRMPKAFDSVKRVCVTCQVLRMASPVRKRDFH